jgi:hypothetical protein
VRFVIAAPLGEIVVCHCSLCRRWSGAAYGAASPVRREGLELVEDQGLAWYVDSNNRSRGFCRTCGCGIFWSAEDDDEIYVSAGALDQPTGLKIEGHMMVASKADWEDLTAREPMYADRWGGQLFTVSDPESG